MTETAANKAERWFDFSPYGMEAKLVVLPSKTRVIVMSGGDPHEKELASLGFKRRDSGKWVLPVEGNFDPRIFLRKFSKVKIVMIPASEFVEYIEAPTQVLEPVKGDIVNRSNSEKVIGINRVGQVVFEDEDGTRFIKQKYGNRIVESDSGSYQPFNFLRSTDSSMLTLCAEAYLLTIEEYKGQDFAKPEVFSENVGATSTQEFFAAIEKALSKALIKDSKLKLEDRYNLALKYQSALREVGVSEVPNNAALMLARRLIGMDKDVIGERVYCAGADQELFQKLLPPRGVGLAESPSDSTILVNFASSAKEAAERMLDRVAGSVTISIIDVRTPAKAEKILDQLSKVVDVEVAAFVEPTAGGPYLLVSSQTTTKPKGDFEMRKFSDAGELWTFASVTATSRSHAIEAVKTGLSNSADLTAAAAYITQNAQQIPYASASKTAQPTLFVPKELKDSTNQALDRLVSSVGEVDQFVSDEFGFSKSKLSEIFSPEQIDGLALAVLNERRGRATLNADGAGTGKGRWNMALIKRAIERGQRAIFFTEGVTNLSDIMRDAKHLGMLGMLKPVVMNAGAVLIDEETNTPFEVRDESVLNDAVSEGIWPHDVNLVLTTYSQFNRIDNHARAEWLNAIVDGDVAIFGDEIHNAASVTSNTSQNLASAIDKAGSVFMSSATHAHTIQMVAFYSRLLPPGMDGDQIRAMMVRGGETFQEVLTSMLVADGVMMRRELDAMDRDFKQSVDIENIDRNREMMDKLSVIISEMVALSNRLDEVVQNRNLEEAEQGFEIKKVGMGSPLHMITRLFDSALMAKTVGKAAVQSLRENAKPVILTDNTIHALIEEGLQLHGGQAPDFKDVLLRVLGQVGKATISKRKAPRLLDQVADDQIMEEVASDEKDAEDFVELVEGGTPALSDDGDRRAIDLIAGDTAFEEDIRQIIKLIEAFPTLPASAIDVVKNTIRDAGFSCVEITGRKLEVAQDGLIRPRMDKDRTVAKNGFNSGLYDAIIINQAGSTGIDLHASERFKDQRRRHFHVLMAPDKIQKELQAYFRVGRRGQVQKPLIHFHSSGLPYKVRLDSMRNNKLRFASATVSGDRQTNLLMEGIPDLINPVGDIVVWNYAYKRPDLVERLQLKKRFFPEDQADVDNTVDKIVEVIAEGKDGETNYERSKREEKQMRIDAIRRSSHLANEFLSRLSLLPVSYQEKVLQELAAEYELTLEEMTAKGENPLRPREIAGIVHVKDKRLFEGSESSSAESSFDGPLHLLDVNIERVADPISSHAVMEMVDGNMASYNDCQTLIKNVLKNIDHYLQPYLPKSASSVEDAVASGHASTIAIVENIYRLREVVEALSPGRQIDFRMPDGESVKAVVAAMIGNPGWEHLSSSYFVTLAIPGEVNFMRYSLNSLIREQPILKYDEQKKPVGVVSYPGLEGSEYEKILTSFDEAKGRRMTPAKILSTNLYSAVRVAAQHGIGQLVSYVDENGRRQRGVLVNKNAEKKLEKASIRLEDPKLIRYALIGANVEINSSPYGTRNSVIITPNQVGGWLLRLPEPKKIRGAVVWPSDAYRALYNQTAQINANLNRIVLQNEDELENALAVIADAGFKTMYVAAKHRDKIVANDDVNIPSARRAGGM